VRAVHALGGVALRSSSEGWLASEFRRLSRSVSEPECAGSSNRAAAEIRERWERREEWEEEEEPAETEAESEGGRGEREKRDELVTEGEGEFRVREVNLSIT
jgi:hypothetical protein